MSKETKLAKKEAKAAKKAAKTEKSQASAYAKLVKNIEKKNAKAEKKATKKNKPFVPTPIPTQEEAFAAGSGSNAKKVITTIVLLLLIAYLGYFCYMFANYVAPTISQAVSQAVDGGEEGGDSGSGEPATYERYVNEHEITTGKTYSVSEAKAFLKQVVHDNWKELGFGSDPSGGSINYTGNISKVNNSSCYIFTTGGKTFAVSNKLNAGYVKDGDNWEPLTFHDVDLMF